MAKTPTLASSDRRPLWQRLLLRRLKFLVIVAVVLGLGAGIVYLFAPSLLLKADAARQALSAHMEKKTIVAGDTTWSYYEGGQGPTIVLLHGFAADKATWLETAKALGEHFHILIPDLPGWGDSSRIDTGDYGIPQQAARLEAFAAAVGAQRFLLVGHSMGGAIAGVYAQQHPERVASLVLMSSLGLTFKDNDFTRDVKSGKNPFLLEDRADLEALLARMFLKPPQFPGRIEDALVARNRKDHAFIERAFVELKQPAQAFALDPVIGKLQMPVLGLWCREDKIIDVSALDTLREGLKSSPSIGATVLNGCNHMPMLEKPEDTARVLTGFALAH
ncbi:Pimeloyl-ACP methyl ester carboxylesterase [Luteibacter sp. UNC138MFCol5.1]|uniref:alpha/beta fold hydrolase n=1 Tax=Luteibacter sp. UNC138MFCol5.1 TaxID=1502774 RepID=UPI0008BBB604|nr:alpha/beta fold hydrolase [Luteibacter sp. UNC138MFCol5.1]SEP01139.1 Pimeloyl-ACP methyl ester carboxylesterase [Luteibacter sp. UNC138MFCol5.1]